MESIAITQRTSDGRWPAAVLFAALALAGVPARADDACRADSDRFCKDVPGHGARRAACLDQHAAELSEPCRVQRGAVKAARQRIAESCNADVQRLCADVQKGAGRIYNCLREHEADLTAACKESMAEGAAVHDAIHPGCRADADKLCVGVTPGNGRIIACLLAHAAELSEACRGKLAARKAPAAK